MGEIAPRVVLGGSLPSCRWREGNDMPANGGMLQQGRRDGGRQRGERNGPEPGTVREFIEIVGDGFRHRPQAEPAVLAAIERPPAIPGGRRQGDDLARACQALAKTPRDVRLALVLEPVGEDQSRGEVAGVFLAGRQQGEPLGIAGTRSKHGNDREENVLNPT